MRGDICHYGIPRGRKTLFQDTRVPNYDDFRNCAKLYALLAIPGAEIPVEIMTINAIKIDLQLIHTRES